MKKRRVLALALALCLLLAGCKGIGEEYELAIGARGSDSYALGEEIAAALAAAGPEVQLVPVETHGTLSSIELLAEGGTEFALLDASLAKQAYAENDRLRAVTAVAPLCVHLVVTNASGILTVSDLRARRVALGSELEGTASLAVDIVEASGLELKDLQRREMTMGDAIEALQSGELDAAFLLAVPGSTQIQQLARNCSVRFIGISGDAARAAMGGREFTEYELPANCYEGQEEAVQTVATDLLLVCDASVSDSMVEAVKRTLDEVLAETLELQGIALRGYAKNIYSIPTHNGATRAAEGGR